MTSSLDAGVGRRKSQDSRLHVESDPFIQVGLKDPGVPVAHDLL